MIPLEEDWQRTLDAVARARGFPTSAEPAKLGALVRALSDAYNDTARGEGAGKVAGSSHAIAARLGFSFARDVPKSHAAVVELVATGALAIPADRPLRVLDVGAGLGATTWGLVRALAAAGAQGSIEATWIDDDAAALDVGQAIAAERRRIGGPSGGVTLTVRTEKRRAAPEVRGSYDVILLGQVLSELDRDLAEAAKAEERAARHVALVRGLLASLDAEGSLVIVEPALRDRTRHLHRVRDALVASGVTLFAPCLHAAPCPALAVEGDWCHEDRAVDLPPWLVPVARAAGLRWQGLTFAYLALRKDARTLRSAIARIAPPLAARVRVVSSPLVSKGKRELFVCGELPCDAHAHLRQATRVRAMLLDRDISPSNEAWSALARGALVTIDPAPDPAKPRVARSARVTNVALALRREAGEAGEPVDAWADAEKKGVAEVEEGASQVDGGSSSR